MDFVARKVQSGRHVAVFCYFNATTQAVYDALRHALGDQVHKATNSRSNQVQAFREPRGTTRVLVLPDRLSESIDLDGSGPCLVHHDLTWNPARLKQRWGRFCRAGTGFHAVPTADIHIPVLECETDKRMFETVKGRFEIGEALMLPADLIDESDEESPELSEMLELLIGEIRGRSD